MSEDLYSAKQRSKSISLQSDSQEKLQDQFQNKLYDNKINNINRESKDDNFVIKKRNSSFLEKKRDDVLKEMPMKLSEHKQQIANDDDDDDGLEQKENAIKEKLAAIIADTGRAARFFKVRNAVMLFNKAELNKDKLRCLQAIREACCNYLMERKTGIFASKASRKVLCEQLIPMIDDYLSARNLPKERDMEDLINFSDELTDDQIDMEILLANKYTKTSGDLYLDENLKTRRNAFKKKIKQVSTAKNIVERISDKENKIKGHINEAIDEFGFKSNTRNEDYDEAALSTVTALAKLQAMNKSEIRDNLRLLFVEDNANRIERQAKCNLIEKIMFEILSWDMKDFTFDRTEDFLNRKDPNGNYGSEVYFRDLYDRLHLAANADVLLAEIIEMSEQNLVQMNMDHFITREVFARIETYKELAEEYETRLKMMSSPYYALLLEKDIKDSSVEDLNRMMEDKEIPDTEYSKEVPEGFKDYIELVQERKERFTKEDRSGHEYTRGADINKIFKHYRKEWHVNEMFVTKEQIERCHIDLRVFYEKTLEGAKKHWK